VFTNKRKDRCRILCWERSGFVLWLKKLEADRFAWPRAA
jgi:transposase